MINSTTCLKTKCIVGVGRMRNAFEMQCALLDAVIDNPKEQQPGLLLASSWPYPPN